MNYFLFQLFPYLAITVFVVGSILRFDRDPYSWRSKSSQFLRRKQLIAGSVLFHVGILVILLGHAVGLLTPVVVFDTLGISHTVKQIMAVAVGGLAGIACLVGIIMLIDRRIRDPRIRTNTSFADMSILLLLLAQLLLGLAGIPVSLQHLDGHEMIKFMEWAQHIVTFRGGAHEFIADTALIYKAHILLGLFILLVFPFTRLVHVFSAPVGYGLRSHYQIVRRREV